MGVGAGREGGSARGEGMGGAVVGGAQRDLWGNTGVETVSAYTTVDTFRAWAHFATSHRRPVTLASVHVHVYTPVCHA